MDQILPKKKIYVQLIQVHNFVGVIVKEVVG